MSGLYGSVLGGNFRTIHILSCFRDRVSRKLMCFYMKFLYMSVKFMNISLLLLFYKLLYVGNCFK